MNQTIYEKLKQVAKAGTTTTYGAIAPLAGLDMESPAGRMEIGRLLGEISEHEHQQGRPMLSVVVVGSESNMPGSGFFTLARQLGKYSGGDDLTFFAKELIQAHAAWN